MIDLRRAFHPLPLRAATSPRRAATSRLRPALSSRTSP
eukprot:CAMPEP_0182908640 /NCGR_PEP_ID=MMETSP0034_2-20130328/35320_1 /TAXON_ID=156128 /ORGANISM="Nephroselmis pyriformis, Strain CCMP717" /LENGTH=37 /DNA_ID= /DNA_START= /DNA_END= /DNA_ORIENTATION=